MKKVLFFVGVFSLQVCLSSFDFMEHKQIGDEAFGQILYRLLEEYKVDKADSILTEAKVLIDTLLNLRHSPKVKEGPIWEELSMSPNYVTYGTLCGLSGDHVENPLLMEKGLQMRYSRLNRTLASEIESKNKFLTGGSPTELLKINPQFGVMAIKDLSHFHNFGKSFNEHLKTIRPDVAEMMKDPKQVEKAFDILGLTNCIGKYFTIHYFAIHLAQEAGKSYYANKDNTDGLNKLYYAILFEAFAEHFLQDGFATGHMFVNRGFSASAVVNNKALHDFYNKIPTLCTNLKGETWYALGDKGLGVVIRNEDMNYEHMRLGEQNLRMYDGLPKEAIDLSERKTELLSQAVIATYTSLLEVCTAFLKAAEGDPADDLEELKHHKDHLDKFIFDNSKVVYCMSIPFGSDSKDLPMQKMKGISEKEFNNIVEEPFSRSFVRLRVANSFSVTLGGSDKGKFILGGRLNLSMFNYNTAKNHTEIIKKGRVLHWISPTISGFYLWDRDIKVENTYDYAKNAQGADHIKYIWGLKGGINYACDIFVSRKNSFSIFSYLEAGIDVRDKVYEDPNVILREDYSNATLHYYRRATTHFTFVPTVGLQLGSLFGIHTHRMPAILRIPLAILLPLQISASYHVVSGASNFWDFNCGIDILF